MEFLLIIGAIMAVIVVVVLCSSGKKSNSLQTPPPPVYKVTHYSGETAVGTYETQRYTTGDGRLYIVQNGHNDYSIISGTYVLERLHETASDQDVAEGKRYRVTLYTDGKALRQWTTSRYTTGHGRLYIVPLGMSEYTIISGTYIIEPVAQAGATD